ncbi:MAG: hypothetical protein ACLFO0_01395 [Guyparkeria sp.]
MNTRWLIMAVVTIGLIWWWNQPAGVDWDLEAAPDAPPGFDADLSIERAPLQTTLDETPTLSAGGFRITPRAEFQIEARVLSRRDYRFDAEAALSPTDLALGWGPMARPEVLEAFEIDQSGRFYRWHTERFPVPREAVEKSSANMHLVPANDWIAADIDRIAEGDTVRLAGHLIDVDGENGWRWRTSLTRSDTGRGACEVLLVSRVQIR